MNGIAVVVSLAIAVPATAADRMAVWSGGEVTRADYESWLTFQNADESESDRRSLIESMLVTQELARGARERLVEKSRHFEMLEAYLEDELLAAEVRARRVAAIVITDEDLDALQQEYPDAFQKPDRRLVREIFKRKPVLARDEELGELRLQMEELRKQILDGADFRELAVRHSDSQTRFRRGAIGFVTPGDLPAALEKVAWQLEPGEVSEILESRDGYLLLYLDRIGSPKEPGPEEVRAMFASNLRAARTRQDWDQFVESKWIEADVEINLDGASETDTVLASYSGGEIRGEDVATALRATARRAMNVDELPVGALRQQVESLVTQRLLAREGRRVGIDQKADFREQMRWKLERALAVDELAHRVDVRLERPIEEEIRQFFESNRQTFVRKAVYELSVIRIGYGSDGAGRNRTDELARALVEEIRSGEVEFAEAAKQYSDHHSAAEGGYMGWMPRPRLALMNQSLAREIVNMGGEGLTREVDFEDAYWLGEVHGLRPQRLLTFEEARDAAEAKLGGARARDLSDLVRAEIREGLDVELVDEGS